MMRGMLENLVEAGRGQKDLGSVSRDEA